MVAVRPDEPSGGSALTRDAIGLRILTVMEGRSDQRRRGQGLLYGRRGRNQQPAAPVGDDPEGMEQDGDENAAWWRAHTFRVPRAILSVLVLVVGAALFLRGYSAQTNCRDAVIGDPARLVEQCAPPGLDFLVPFILVAFTLIALETGELGIGGLFSLKWRVARAEARAEDVERQLLLVDQRINQTQQVNVIIPTQRAIEEKGVAFRQATTPASRPHPPTRARSEPSRERCHGDATHSRRILRACPMTNSSNS